ncbi:hypothetical protein LJCM5344_10300 [Lactobacillus paragasseri]|nr:hypothetical protein LJCM5344_10300 [Lactobacillus paragasseri]
MTRKQQQCPYCHFDRHQHPILNSDLSTKYINLAVEIDESCKIMTFIINDEYGIKGDKININYCPMCGRKL